MDDTLSGLRVLVVEDEYFIAMDVARAITDAGAQVVGPVPQLDQGLALADGEHLDAAVLDVHLEGGFSYAIAESLTRRSVPYLLLTGYDTWALPEQFRDVPRLTKPIQLRTLTAHLRALLGDALCP
ncbi:response regulator [Sphingomonas pokkalii]|uniref:Response regulator n=2 Tax=Sphingomonas pokkalii TaxID=2175090 RepID=A0A2U0SJ92_9SPHN|nr:response regulator [Sphingomonas pokkalii]